MDLCPITVVPPIVSSETILFWKWKMWKFSYSFRIMAIFLLHKLNNCRSNYWRGETIEGRKLFAEIRYCFYTNYNLYLKCQYSTLCLKCFHFTLQAGTYCKLLLLSSARLSEKYPWMCFLSTFYAIRRCAHFDLFTLAGNINNNQVELELQPHLVIQGVSFIVRRI